MPVRGPGVFPCAHCRKTNGKVACTVCGSVVCSDCAADWTTCGTPVARQFRLGIGARLRSVSPNGQYGLVSKWDGSLALFDLRRVAYIEPPPDSVLNLRRWDHPETRSTALVFDDQLAVPTSHGVELLPLAYEDWSRVEVDIGPFDITRTPLTYTSDCTVAWTTNPDETVCIFDLLERKAERVTPMPREVVQAAAVDGRGRMVAATWSRVDLHVRSAGELERVGSVEMPPQDIGWVGVAGDRIVVCGVPKSTWPALELCVLGELDFRAKRRGPEWVGFPEIAWGQRLPLALSPDGRYLAVAAADRVVWIVDVERGRCDRLWSHSDDVCLVRFTADGDHLFTADCDNRVCVWPRRGGGFHGDPLEQEPADDVELRAGANRP